MESSEFVEWLKGKGFIDSSIAKITGEEFSKADELLWLTKDDIDRLNLKLAQRKLLENIISSQGSPVTHDTPVSTYRKTEDLSPSEMLDQGLESLSLDKDELFDSMPKRRSDRVQLTHERKTSRDIGQLEKEREDFLDREMRLVKVGITGSGKSATGNTILGKNVFESKMHPGSVTKECSSHQAERFGQRMKVIDVPGFVDTSMNDAELKAAITQCFVHASPGIHAILYVIRLGRYTKQDQVTLDTFLEWFGADALKYVIAVFTRLEDIEDEEMGLKKYLSLAEPPLKNFLTSIEHRYIAVNNKQKINDNFVKNLQEEVKALINSNGNKYFTNNKLQEVDKLMKSVQIEEMKKGGDDPINTSKWAISKSAAAIALVVGAGAGAGGLLAGPLGAVAGAIAALVCGIVGTVLRKKTP